MKKTSLTLIFIFTILTFGFASDLYQTGTINALLKGHYQGVTTVKQVKEYGTMGLGCGVGLGEVIGCDGNFYLADGYGNIILLDDNQKTPFLDYIKFRPEISLTINNVKTLNSLEEIIDKKLVSNNIFYAIKIQGTFNSINARSEDVAKLPYQPLAKWLRKHQHKFTEKDVVATIIAFKCPDFVKGISVPGYHLHFITQDKKRGGHVLGLNIETAKVEIQPIYNFNLQLSKHKEYLKSNMSYTSKTDSQLKKIESGK